MSAQQQQVTRALDDLFTTTWYSRRPKVVDQVFKITPLFDLMTTNGRVKERVPDGTHWEIPISYDKLDQNLKWFGRADHIGAQEKESITALIYETRNLATALVRYWDDDRKNRGKAKVIDYVNYKLDNTKAAIGDNLEVDMWVQNPNPKAMTALETLVSTTPTVGTVGGLNRANNSWMANQILDMTSFSWATDGIDKMTNIFNTTSRYKAGTRRSPDIILTTQEIYEAYESIARSLQMIVTQTSDRVSLGFGNLAFKGVEMYWAPECPAGRMYMLNSEHLELTYDPAAWFEMTEWKPIAGTSLDRVAQILSVLNLCADNFQKHGVIFNINPDS